MYEGQGLVLFLSCDLPKAKCSITVTYVVIIAYYPALLLIIQQALFSPLVNFLLSLRNARQMYLKALGSFNECLIKTYHYHVRILW